jgi:ABC-type glycerol-3-phosphate transport system permease component
MSSVDVPRAGEPPAEPRDGGRLVGAATRRGSLTGFRSRRRLVRWLTFALAVGFGVVMLIPFALMVSTAFKSHAYVLEIPPRLIPAQPTIDNFVEAWTGQDFGRFFVNSVIVAVASTALAVSLGSMLAFAFARYSFPGRRILFGALLFTMMVPGMVLLIPQFVLAKNLGLLNSLVGLVVVYAAMNLGLNVFLLRGFFGAMPQEMFDAAEVDGAGVWSSFWRVGVPLARPGIATVTLFSFLAAWDEFTWAIVSLSNKELYTLPIAIRSLQRAQATEWGLVFAASLIALGPVLLLFVLLQKQFVSGAFVGATKG